MPITVLAIFEGGSMGGKKTIVDLQKEIVLNGELYVLTHYLRPLHAKYIRRL